MLKEEKLLKFNITLHCKGCEARIGSFFSKEKNVHHWKIERTAGENIFYVHANGITEGELMHKVQEAGFEVQPLKSP